MVVRRARDGRKAAEGRPQLPALATAAPGAGERVRARHDGFTPKKQRKFFKVLKKTGCLADGCRAAGISANTVRRWRDKDAAFDGKVEAALAIASVELDAIAWKRATEGTEERVYRDGRLVFTRVKQSDAMLRLLMQGANPGKYGRTGRMPKRAVMKELRKEAEAAVRKTLCATKDELIEGIKLQLGALRRRQLAKGYGEGPDGGLVPPGWKLVPDAPALPAPEPDEEREP